MRRGYRTNAMQQLSQGGLWDVPYTIDAARATPAVSNAIPARRRISEPTINPKSPRLTNGALGKSRIANGLNRNCANTIGEPGVAIAPAAPIHPDKRIFPERNATRYNLDHVPDVSATHNHKQNAETFVFHNLPLKMASSRINDGHDVLGAGPAQVSVAPTRSPRRPDNHSRINDGHDIFGNAVSDFKRPPPGACEDLQERPNRSAVKPPWI